MLPVSQAWRKEIAEQFRFQGYLQISLEIVPPGLVEGATSSSTDTEPISTTDNLVFGSGSLFKRYASFEANRWLLDGVSILRTADTVIPEWWSTLMSAGSKVLSIQFDREYTFPGLSAVWDEAFGTAPTKLTLLGLNLSGIEVGRYTFEDPLGLPNYLEAPMQDVSKVLIQIEGWSISSWRARASRIVFGLYTSYDSINNGRVVSGNSSSAADPLNRQLPTHTMSLTLRNIDRLFDPTLQTGVAKYFAQRQQAKVRWGFTTSPGQVEWSPNLVYYLDSFSIPEDSKDISLGVTSRLAFLTQDARSVTYDGSSKNFYDLATEVLSLSGIIKESANETPWVLSDRLKTLSTTAPVPKMATNAVLQLIASACMCWLTTDPTTGYVALLDLQEPEQCLLGLAQQLGDPAITVAERVHTITVGVYSYSKESGSKSIAKGSYAMSVAQDLSIGYNVDSAADVTYVVTNGAVESFEAYSSMAKIRVIPVDTTKPVTVELLGSEVKKSVTYVQTYKDETITHGLDLTVENPLITDSSTLSDLTQWLLKWYTITQTHKIPYTGFPEVFAGDASLLTTIYKENYQGTVIRNDITFNGGFSGTMEVI